MNLEILDKLRSIVGEDWVITDPSQMEEYVLDETPGPAVPEVPEGNVLVKPGSTEEISDILSLAADGDIDVVPRGGGTGLCGGAIPITAGIILSLERLNEITDLDQDNMMVTCQAGATLESLFERLEEVKGLFFPPHPGDEGAQIGGLVATNAGGARAVKYGVVRNYVKGITAVLPTGQTLHLGGKVLKDNTGYDLLHLLIGSEGTLAVITEVTLRLFPEPKQTATLVVPYPDRHQALESVPPILREGFLPLALEYVERDLVQKSADHLGKSWPADQGQAYLMFIVEASSESHLYSKCEIISDLAEERGALDILFAQSRKDQQNILDIRSNIYTALEADSADILDVTVPPASMRELMDRVDEIGREFDISIPMYGHAGDGNLHPHIPADLDSEAVEEVKERVYEAAQKLGGVITGEHGVGYSRVKNLAGSFPQHHLDLMRRIKKSFDSQGNLNPGKVVPPGD